MHVCVHVYAHVCLHVRMCMGTQACGNPWLTFCLPQALSTLFTEASQLVCNPQHRGGSSLPVTPEWGQFAGKPSVEGKLSYNPSIVGGQFICNPSFVGGPYTEAKGSLGFLGQNSEPQVQ